MLQGKGKGIPFLAYPGLIHAASEVLGKQFQRVEQEIVPAPPGRIQAGPLNLQGLVVALVLGRLGIPVFLALVVDRVLLHVQGMHGFRV